MRIELNWTDGKYERSRWSTLKNLRMLTRRDQGGLPQADRSACWYQPVELETCITHEKPRPPADPSSPSFHTSPTIAQRAHFKQSSGIRSRGTSVQGWWWWVHTTNGVRTSTIESQEGQTHNKQHVLWHKCDKLLVRWAFNTSIWCLLPQLLWCMSQPILVT